MSAPREPDHIFDLLSMIALPVACWVRTVLKMWSVWIFLCASWMFFTGIGLSVETSCPINQQAVHGAQGLILIAYACTIFIHICGTKPHDSSGLRMTLLIRDTLVLAESFILWCVDTNYIARSLTGEITLCPIDNWLLANYLLFTLIVIILILAAAFGSSYVCLRKRLAPTQPRYMPVFSVHEDSQQSSEEVNPVTLIQS